jgi:hypothetical protein
MLGNEIKHHRQRLGLSCKKLARLSVWLPTQWMVGNLASLRCRSVQLRVALERLEIRHQEMLSSPGSLREWDLWLEQFLLGDDQILRTRWGIALSPTIN